MINHRLLAEKHISILDGMRIQKLQNEADAIKEHMRRCNDIDLLRDWASEWTRVQFDLQKLWGFPQNATYHKWWYLPQCTCPKIDNEDRYPIGFYYISEGCPIHGGIDD